MRTLCDEVALLEHGELVAVGPSGEVIDDVPRRRARATASTDGEHGTRWGSGEAPHRRHRAARRRRPPGDVGAHRRLGHVPAPLPSDEPIDKPVFALAIHTLEGMHVTAPNTRDAGYTTDRIDGDGQRRPPRRPADARTGHVRPRRVALRLRVHAHVRLPAPRRSASTSSAALPEETGRRHVAGWSLERPRASGVSSDGSGPAAHVPARRRAPRVGRDRQLPRRRRHASPASTASRSSTGRPSSSRSSSSTTRRATAASSGSATAAPDVTLIAVEGEHRVRRWLQPRCRGTRRRRTSRSSTTTPAPIAQWLTRRGRRARAPTGGRVRRQQGARLGGQDDRLRRAAAMSFYGHGFKLHVGDPDIAGTTSEADVLFASGAAMVIDADGVRSCRWVRRALLHVLRGRRPRLAALAPRLPGPLRARVARLPPAPRIDVEVGHWREHYLLERNALYTIYKNYDDENLARGAAGRARADDPAGVVARRRRSAHARSRSAQSGDDDDRRDRAQGDARPAPSPSMPSSSSSPSCSASAPRAPGDAASE